MSDPGAHPHSSPHAPRARASRIAALVVAVLLTVFAAGPAAAHTDLDISDPADGDRVRAPLEEVRLTFTLPVTPLGDAAVITGPGGPVPATVEQAEDGVVLVVTPATPLGAGDFAVTWTVAAQDGHPLDGDFAFVVEELGQASPSPTGVVSPSAAASPSPSASPAPADADGVESSPTPSAVPAEPMDVPHEGAEPETSDALAQAVARAGSAVALWALLVGAGSLAFAAIALRGADRAEVPRVLAGVRWCGALLLGGLALRVVGRAAVISGGSLADAFSDDALGDALAGTAAWVVGLQAAGGLAMAVGAWRSVPASWLAGVGAVIAGAGHVLGGHSNTAEPRWLVVGADVAHLVAAAVWLGGVVALLAVLRSRRRDGRPADAGPIAVRFGVVAAGSFVVVGVAGVLLAWSIAEEVSDLWTSTWGVVLLIKVVLVLVVAAMGAYTHFRLVPRLVAADRDVGSDATATAAPEAAGLRRAAAAEALVFVLVVVATAVLVASSAHG
ncbi:copper resistance CopC/CopD family protein [Demequina pelophila]|uniref:copper resistance CopC/CopD family protein n=1 Tax=Demequina pelophila TaxID=1638984 RepID=UPI000780E473|nr:CopD family protein [Demequina pelophila]